MGAGALGDDPSLAGTGLAPLPMTGRNAGALTLTPGLVYSEYFGDSDVWAPEPGASAPGTSRALPRSHDGAWPSRVGRRPRRRR